MILVMKKKKKILENLSLGCNKRLLQCNLIDEDDIGLSLKDLSNYQALNKTHDGNNLKKAVQFLINTKSEYI